MKHLSKKGFLKICCPPTGLICSKQISRSAYATIAGAFLWHRFEEACSFVCLATFISYFVSSSRNSFAQNACDLTPKTAPKICMKILQSDCLIQSWCSLPFTTIIAWEVATNVYTYVGQIHLKYPLKCSKHRKKMSTLQNGQSLSLTPHMSVQQELKACCSAAGLTSTEATANMNHLARRTVTGLDPLDVCSTACCSATGLTFH